jgi:hypothetical protein
MDVLKKVFSSGELITGGDGGLKPNLRNCPSWMLVRI